MNDEYEVTSWEWENDDGDVVWINLNDNNCIEITPKAFEMILGQAGYSPV